MKRSLFFYALLSVLLASQPGVAQKVVQPRPQPPRPPASAWIPVAIIAVRQPVGHAGAMLSGAYHSFRYLKLRVNNRALTLNHVLVSYDNGSASNLLPLCYRLLPDRDIPHSACRAWAAAPSAALTFGTAATAGCPTRSA